MCFRTKTIKNTPLVQLVESFRNAEGQPRQRVLASLGDSCLPENKKHLNARAVESHLDGQPVLIATEKSRMGNAPREKIPKSCIRSAA